MKKKSNAQSGFTIVELLVYTALLGILLTVLVDIFVSILKAQVESEATSSAEEDSRFLLSRLTYDNKRADSIAVPASLGSSANSLVLVIGGVNYTYSVDNNGNMDINNGTTDVLNSYDTTVSGFNVIRQGNPGGKNTITITFTVTSKAKQGSNPEVRTVNTTIGTR